MKLSTKCQQIILASSSKARIEYLERQKINFQVRQHRVDESIIKKKNYHLQRLQRHWPKRKHNL